MVATARLETGPAAIQLRDGDDRREQPESRIEVAPLRVEVGWGPGIQLHEQSGAA